jgi:hypothetical protein
MFLRPPNSETGKKIIKLLVHIRNFFKLKLCLASQKEMEPNICMGVTQRNLQARPKILKKLLEHQFNQSGRTFSQKKVC